MSVEGKTALVTGGGTGIGRALALDLAAAGARVIVNGRRPDKLDDTVAAIAKAGGSASAIAGDMTDPDDIQRVADLVLGETQGVDILVNNAGFSSKVRSAKFIGAEEWQSVMDVNTMGPAMLTRCLLPSMIDRKGGDIVMVSSMAGLRPNDGRCGLQCCQGGCTRVHGRPVAGSTAVRYPLPDDLPG